MRLPLPVGGTIVLGFAALIAAATQLASAPLGTVALVAAALVAVELLEESEPARRREPLVTHPFRAASALHVAAIVVIGPWAACLVAGLAALAVRALRGLDRRTSA